MVKSKIVTCVDGVDERTQNHHFCQSPFSTIRHTLDRHCNEVDCNEIFFLQLEYEENWLKLNRCDSILTSVDSAAYSECSVADDSALDTPELAPNDDDHDLARKINTLNTSNNHSIAESLSTLTILPFVVFVWLIFVAACPRNR